MKLLRSYNTDISILTSWEVTDKTKTIELIDEENGYVFSINFGEKPNITVFKNSDKENIEENWGEMILDIKEIC